MDQANRWEMAKSIVEAAGHFLSEKKIIQSNKNPRRQALFPPKLITLLQTNSSPLKIDGWKMNFLLGNPKFKCYVSFREGTRFFQVPLLVVLVTFSDVNRDLHLGDQKVTNGRSWYIPFDFCFFLGDFDSFRGILRGWLKPLFLFRVFC